MDKDFKAGDIVHLKTPSSHIPRPMVVRGIVSDPDVRPALRTKMVSCNWIDNAGVPWGEEYDPAQLVLNQDQGE